MSHKKDKNNQNELLKANFVAFASHTFKSKEYIKLNIKK